MTEWGPLNTPFDPVGLILGKVNFKIIARTFKIKFICVLIQLMRARRSLSSLLWSLMLKWYLKSKYVFPKSYSPSFGIIVKFYIRHHEALLQSHRIALDTKSSQLQYKLPNRRLTTNVFLRKIGIIPSPAPIFVSRKRDESLDNIFVTFNFTKKFWADVIKWMGN